MDPAATIPTRPDAAPASGEEIRRFGDHRNSFGFLRLLFASLVIVSHTPEIVDGDRHRELLTMIFGTISFGDLAVDGFFLISGYLITGSYLKDSHPWRYLSRRVVRIYPAFIVASLVCLLVVGPLAGLDVRDPLSFAVRSALYMIGLQPPSSPGVFSETHYPVLNLSMWTIAYEARCYVLVLIVGGLGLFRRPRLLLALALASVVLSVVVEGSGLAPNDAHPYRAMALGEPIEVLRLTGMFFVGSGFYLFRDAIAFTPRTPGLAAVALVACLSVPQFAEPGVATFGAYLLFAFAHTNRTGLFSEVNNRNDISYGVYLYAFPIGGLMFWYVPSTPLPAAIAVTLLLACVCGWLSWTYVEKPLMKRLRGLAGAGRGTPSVR